MAREVAIGNSAIRSSDATADAPESMFPDPKGRFWEILVTTAVTVFGFSLGVAGMRRVRECLAESGVDIKGVAATAQSALDRSGAYPAPGYQPPAPSWSSAAQPTYGGGVGQFSELPKRPWV